MTSDPELHFEQLLARQTGRGGVLQVEFSSCFEGLAAGALSLLALYEWEWAAQGPRLTRFVVTDEVGRARRLADEGGLDQVALALEAPIFDPVAPALLTPVSVPKPWGREIWYTGIEKRGVSRVGDGRFTVPLPWYLGAAPWRLAHRHHKRINLLKILDPVAEPVLGDLYFELHEQKQEVYVVTAVDRTAWSDGVGAIRLGFDPTMRSRFRDEDEFRAGYGAAVARYREVRVEIDRLIDGMRVREGVGLSDPVAPDRQRRWQSAVPEALQRQEEKLRTGMEAFTRLWPLQVGDVVQVPLRTPHALQHGVRTVEFQTPVYERKILSFGQKVLTQAHWDTDEAVAAMALDVPRLSTPAPLAEGADWTLDRIVTFDDFSVDRLRLAPSSSSSIAPEGEYALMMVVGEGITVGALEVGHEQACFLPAERPPLVCHNSGTHAATLLLARPR